ncbi:MAG: calcium-translocating P-type ATPase, PMCA-type [Prevotellaceae bacterium]|jgi:Ca2+-transporting ATPase|nr:calcium-translocating P-type ATPase, PMCA-type [Prevotellaceae bacterium]
MSTTTKHTAYAGLSDAEVKASRDKYGVNRMMPPQRPSFWKLYLEKFKDPIIRILLATVILSFVISVVENEYAETIGIAIAILLATGIGFYFEYDAGKKFDVLNSYSDDVQVKVIRSGEVVQIARHEVVVDDIVLLEIGEEIPADGILLEAASMQVDESSLTGEPSTDKTTNEELFDKEATYPSNKVSKGTYIIGGHGLMRVVAVGDGTEFGQLAKASAVKTDSATPLTKQLDRLAKWIGRIGISVSTLIFVIFLYAELNVYVAQYGWTNYVEIARIVLKYFMMAVTLIVVCVPEGLPMSVTLSLALNMRRMLSTNNLVRELHACETMGAVSVICTDKTGTLTENKMQVQEVLAAEEAKELLKENMAVNSTAHLRETGDNQAEKLGNPTEVALLLWLRAHEEDYRAMRERATVISEVPFSTERKYMARLITVNGERRLLVKGAPEIVLTLCKDVVTDGGRHIPVAEYQETLENQVITYQQRGMRTLGFAYLPVRDAEEAEPLLTEGGLTFLGVVVISDPVRSDVPAAVGQCRSAGINVKIVTGDTTYTATEIARQIGLWTETDTDLNRITGVEFSELSEEEAAARVKGLKVIARARPLDKQRLVRLLQEQGEVVAVTGDGTNDAPALRRADVGLAMGTGTAVAKEAGAITLLDDSFRSIATAVMWGRSLYKNIQRFVVFQLTINLVALLLVLIGSFTGGALPLTVTQMLWVNLIMDTFAALALASIPPTPSVMENPPRRPNDFIVTRAMLVNIVVTGLLLVIPLMIWYFMNAESSSSELPIYPLTIFFTWFVMAQFWNLLNARVFGSTQSAFRGLWQAHGMLLVLLLILIGQFVIVQWGGKVFRTVPLDLPTWIIILATSSFVLWIGEIVRAVRRLKVSRA